MRPANPTACGSSPRHRTRVPASAAGTPTVGVGAVTERRLADAGISTVGDLAALGESRLCSLLGRSGPASVRVVDGASIHVASRWAGVVGRSVPNALGRRPKTRADLDTMVIAIVDGLGKRLRKAERLCRTVVLRIRFDDFSRATRSRTLWEPTDRTDVIMSTARTLLDDAAGLLTDRGCTLVGVSLTNLDDTDAVQLTLLSTPITVPNSTPRWTACANASAATPSPARCWWAITTAPTPPCSPTDRSPQFCWSRWDGPLGSDDCGSTDLATSQFALVDVRRAPGRGASKPGETTMSAPVVIPRDAHHIMVIA